VDGDGRVELPYVNSSGALKVNDSANEAETLVAGGSTASPDTGKSRLAAGAWDGNPPAVYYADDSHDTIYRVTTGGSPVEVADPDNGVNAVAGIGDIDGDGTAELVFADGSQAMRYVEPAGARTGALPAVEDGGAGSNNGIGSGSPPDFDGDGTVSVVIVTGSNTVKLASDRESTRYPAESTINTDSAAEAAKSPATAADVDEDGEEEIVYLDQSEYVRYIDDVGGANTVEYLRDEDGNRVAGRDDLGVVS
jgi:hypothetical protein